MIRSLDLLLRLTIWFLLTSDFSLANIAIGLTVALLLPRCRPVESALSDWLLALGEVAIAIPVAYKEAIEIMIRPHNYEDVTLERVKPNRTPGLIFLDIFLITFTPKTVVLNYQKDGCFEVHNVRRRPRRPPESQAEHHRNLE